MRRRDVVCGAAAWLAGTRVARAQRRKARIGYLGGIAPNAEALRTQVEPLLQGLRELGYVEGRNFDIHYRWAEGVADRLPALAAELLKLDLDVLVTAGPRPAVVAKGATGSVPIVALGVDDPVEMGLAAEFARPGGNVTGISSFGSELVAKRLQLMKDLVPSIRRVAVLANPTTTTRASFEPVLQRFERGLGVPIRLYEAAGPEQFAPAFEAMRRDQMEGVLVLADASFWTHRSHLHELVAKHRLPSVWGGRGYLDGGGLASYQSDWPALYRRGAALVDRVLKGARPAVTPFEQSTKLELVINLKAATALGITVPPALLVAADDVIR